MSESIGPLNFGDNERQPFLGYSLSQGRSYSEATAGRIDAEVRHIVDAAYAHTVELVRNNKDKLDALAKELLENEIVEGKRVYELVGREPAPEVEDPTVAPKPQEGLITGSA